MIRLIGSHDTNGRVPVHTLENHSFASPTAFGWLESPVESESFALPTAFGFLPVEQESFLDVASLPCLRITDIPSIADSVFDWENCCGVGIGDLSYTEEFANLSDITVIHNLGKYPSVSVLNASGQEVQTEVHHLDTNTVFVDWKHTLSGRIILN